MFESETAFDPDDSRRSKKFYEEGDLCPECESGHLQHEEVENCNCHNVAPCSACINNPLICDECGEETEV
jgi:hypothetical protein